MLLYKDTDGREYAFDNDTLGDSENVVELPQGSISRLIGNYSILNGVYHLTKIDQTKPFGDVLDLMPLDDLYVLQAKLNQRISMLQAQADQDKEEILQKKRKDVIAAYRQNTTYEQYKGKFVRITRKDVSNFNDCVLYVCNVTYYVDNNFNVHAGLVTKGVFNVRDSVSLSNYTIDVQDIETITVSTKKAYQDQAIYLDDILNPDKDKVD